jgi:multidrug resistance efflux pump
VRSPAEEVELPKESGVADRSSGHKFTAREQHKYLEDAIDRWDAFAETDADDRDIAPVVDKSVETDKSFESEEPRRGFAISVKRRSLAIKSIAALAAAFALGWVPIQQMFISTSTEAVVNAALISLRAPISGWLSPDLRRFEPGMEVHAGESIFTIRNALSDRGRLDQLKQEVANTQSSLMALNAKHDALEKKRSELVELGARYKQGRVQALERQVAGLEAQIEAAQARQREITRDFVRKTSLFSKGVVSEQNLDEARRDEAVAGQNIIQLNEQRNAAQVALKFAREGVFISDGYNDTPVSVQGLLDVDVELAGINASIKGALHQLKSERENLAAEQGRQTGLSVAEVRSAVTGRVWDAQVAAGEHVNAGQILFRVLDCRTSHVTATVSESVYQKLLIGQKAQFRPDDGGPTLNGWVSGLNGLAVVATNEAIPPSLLTRAPYHVTIELPELREKDDCRIGRSGSVRFDTADRAVKAIASIDSTQ